MKKMKRLFCLVLVLAVSLGLLSGCGGGGTDDPDATPTPATGTVYVPSFTAIDGETFQYIRQCIYVGGRLIVLARVQGEEVTSSYQIYDENGEPLFDENGEPVMEEYSYFESRMALFSMAEDGSDLQELAGYVPAVQSESEWDSCNINQMFAGQENSLWVLEQVTSTIFDLPADFDENTMNRWDYYVSDTNTYYLRQLDATGAELSRVDMSFLQGDSEWFYLNYFCFDGAGNLYVSDGDGNVHVLDGSGAKLLTLEGTENSWINGLVTVRGGGVAANIYDGGAGAQMLRPIDLERKAYGEGTPAPVNAYNFLPGSDDYDFYYNTGSSLFGFDMDSGESEKLVTWLNVDVDGDNLGAVVPLPDGRILCTSTDYMSDSAKTEIITLTPTPAAEVEQKKTLVFACFGLDYNLRAQILNFNRAGGEYRIEVNDYSEYATEDDYTAGLTRLTTEILTGTVPDIFATANLPTSRFAAKGVLEDLWPWIEQDSALGGREGVIQPVFDALTEDGKLTQIVSSFSLMTVMGATEVVGDKTGWSLDDLLAARERMPAGADIFALGTTKSGMLSTLCYMSLDSFVDWQTGLCSFDSEEFIQLLEFANLFPAEYDWSGHEWTPEDDEMFRIMDGRQMLAQPYFGDFSYYQLYKTAFGGEATCVGFPGSSGNGAAFQIQSGLAMSASCTDKEAAWSFMRTILTESYQTENSWNFPTNKAAFDTKLKDAMTPEYYTDENGEQVEMSKNSWWISEDRQLEVYALTQAEADEVMALIEGTDRIYTYDESLYEIIQDAAAPFLAGQRNAADTAREIQSRVSLYVNEQR